MASEPGPVMQLLGQVAYHFEMMRPLLPTYLHLLVSAIFPIYTAAHASLARPTSAARPKGKKGADDDDKERDEDDTPTQLESLTPSDAIMFPLLAGGTLASLYFILKWLQDPAWLNWALGLYFSQVGLFFATKFIKDGLSVLRSFVFPSQFSRRGQLWKVDQQEKCFRTETGKTTSSPFAGLLGRTPLPTAVSARVWDVRALIYSKARLELHIHKVVTFKSPVEFLDVLSLISSCGIVYYHTFIGKPWFLTNFLGFSFCYGSLQYVTPTTAWTGTLILGALFFYDIYFVFYTPMMVTVATKLEVPIKLLFPRPDGCVMPAGMPEGSAAMEEYARCIAKKRTMAMLGLGDIVVPGMILAFALRFDLYLHYLRQGGTDEDKDSKTSKPTYASAKGSFGERFWTSSKLWTKQLRAKQFPKRYLYATIGGYLFGMVVTVVVMQVAQHAQPALLYLVPGVLGSLWGTALIRGDLKILWKYSETPDSLTDNKNADVSKSEKKISKSDDDAMETEHASKGDDVKAEKISKGEKSESAEDVAEKTCRRLVYLSITLPDTAHGTSEKNSKNAKTTVESSKRNLTTDEGKSNGSVASKQERQDGGEPPGKRARKS